MRVLVDTDGYDDGPQPTVVVHLRVQDITYLDERGLNMGEVGLAAEPVNGLKLGEVGAFTELETQSLNDGACGLKVHVGFLGVKTQRSIVRDVFPQGDFSSF